MAVETKWLAVAPQLFTADGTTQGVVTISNTSGFKVKQLVVISQTGLPDLQLQVKRVPSSTQFIVGPIPTKVGQSMLTVRQDISAYTVSGGAFCYAEEQDKVKLKIQDINEAVYDQEPAVALRSVLVDQFGFYYDTVIDNLGRRRLAVDAAVSISGVTVDLDAFTKIPPDNAISVGTEDGTKGGVKHALKIASNGLLQVQDLASETSLASILAALGSGITVTGTVNVGNFPSVQAISGSVSVSNFPATQPISGTVAVSNFPAIQTVSVNNFPATQPISAVSLPLPTGAATSANQVTEIAGLSAINTTQTDGSQKTQVTASALPTGAATSANQAVEIASLASIDGKLNSLGQKTKAGSVPVTFPSDADPVPTMILFTKPWDAIGASYPSAAVEVYQSYVGGLAGTLQQTATVTYTDGTKNVLLSVVRT